MGRDRGSASVRCSAPHRAGNVPARPDRMVTSCPTARYVGCRARTPFALGAAASCAIGASTVSESYASSARLGDLF